MANPYGIEQVDVPGILSAFTTARTQRTQQLLTERAMAREDAQLERENRLRTAYAKLRLPGADGGMSSAVSAYGVKDAPAAAPAGPVAPADFGQSLGGPGAVATAAPPAAPAAPATPTDATPHPLQGWLDTNQGAIQDIMQQDPQSGLQLLQHFHQLDAEKQQAVKDHLVFADQVNQTGLKLLFGVHDQASWDAARQNYGAFLKQYNLPAPNLPDTYDPKTVQGLLEQGQSVQEHLNAMKPVVLAEGSSLVNPVTRETIATNEKATKYQPVTIHNADGSSRAVAFNPDKGVFEDAPAGAAGGASVGPVGTSPKAAVVASALSQAGLPPAVVAGFMGNFHVEGGYDGAKGDGGSASGIGQWHADRASNFKSVIGKDVTAATPAEQAQFVAWEMQHPAAAGMTVAQRDQILAAKTPAQAAELIDKFYERSSGRDRSTRMAAAAAFAGGGSVASSGGSRSVSGAPAPHDAGDDDTAKFIGGQVALGQPMPPLGMGKEAAAMRRAILAEATKQWRAMGISPGEANVIAAQNKSGLAELAKIAAIKANVQTAENTANSNASQVLSLLGSAGTTGSPIFNAWQQAGRRATGDAKVSAFDVAVKTLATEYARVMTGGGNAPLSDSARHEADALLHTSMTPAQFQATIKQMKIDMANRSAGIEQERQATLNQIRTGGRGGHAAPASVTHITNDADYAKLPSGAHFIAPDGSHRIKP